VPSISVLKKYIPRLSKDARFRKPNKPLLPPSPMIRERSQGKEQRRIANQKEKHDRQSSQNGVFANRRYSQRTRTALHMNSHPLPSGNNPPASQITGYPSKIKKHMK